MEIKVTFNDQGLERAFRKKAGEANNEFNKLAKDLTDIAHRWVQNEAPRKTGNLKASVKKVVTGNRGLVFVSKYQAPYYTWVLDGTRPHKIVPKNKKALRVPGFGVFKSVQHPGTKSNPFIDKASTAMEGQANARISLFEKWLGEV